MKDIRQYIEESTQDEDLQYEIGLALKDFGNVKNGFKMTPIDDIKDAMYKAGFDFDEESSDDEKMVFYGEYIDTKYEVTLYAKDHVNGKFQIHNFNVIEA